MAVRQWRAGQPALLLEGADEFGGGTLPVRDPLQNESPGLLADRFRRGDAEL